MPFSQLKLLRGTLPHSALSSFICRSLKATLLWRGVSSHLPAWAGSQHVGPSANCPFKSPPPAPPSSLWPDFPIRAPPFKVTAPSFWPAVYTNRRAQGALGVERGHKWAVTGACGTWNHHPGLRRDPELGQGGSWDGAEALGSGLDTAFLSSLCVPGTESIPFRSFCGAIITPILQTGQRSPEQLADLPRALQLTKWQSQGPNSGQCDSEALMSYPLHHLPDRSWLPPRLPFFLGFWWGREG